MKCDTCGKLFGGWEQSLVYDRGYWWHRPCAKMLTESTVDFPSAGKLVPATIMEAGSGSPASAGSPSDELRLNWLIDHGAYGLIDHDEYFGLTVAERRKEMRRRVDEFLSKENAIAQTPPESGTKDHE